MARRSTPFFPPIAAVLIVALAVFVPLWIAASHGALFRLELLAYDLGTWAVSVPTTNPPNVMVVGVTEDDIFKRHDYPVSDESLAQAMEKLESLHPAAIGVDIYRDFPIYSRRDVAVPGAVPAIIGPDHLAQVLRDHPNIVMTWKAEEPGAPATPPPAVLLSDPRFFLQIGFSDMALDPDGIYRLSLLTMSSANQADAILEPLRKHSQLLSLEMTLAISALRASGMPLKFDPDKTLNLNAHRWPSVTDGDGPYLGMKIDGYRLLADFVHLQPIPKRTLTEVLENRLDESEVKGKVVLIGGTAPSTGDQKYTPLGTAEYGVILHARAVDQLIRAARGELTPPRFWTASRQCAWLAFWVCAGALMGLVVRGPWRFGTAIAAGIAAICLLFVAALGNGFLIPVIAPAIGWIAASVMVTAYLFLRERDDRTALTKLFVTHVDRAVFDVIWDQRDELLEEGRIRPRRAMASILFTDLKGFSAASETMEADELMHWLNEYMEEMSSAITRHQGVILKYIGDSVMAAFGIPLASDDPAAHAADAVRAVDAALDMRRALGKLNARWLAEGRAQAQMRVGIFTGPLVVGSLGSAQRLEYTCLGETVNTASRLESYDKSLMDADIAADGCRILISEKTGELVGGAFLLRSIGDIELHNISGDIKAFGVIGRNKSPGESSTREAIS